MGFLISLNLGGIAGILWLFARLGDPSTPGWKARNLFFMLTTVLGVGAGGTFPSEEVYGTRVTLALFFWLAATAVVALPAAIVRYLLLVRRQSSPPSSEQSTTPPPLRSERSFTLDEDAIYSVIGEELETGKVDRGLWTRLFAQYGGDETKTKVLYIEQRASRLIACERERLEQAGSTSFCPVGAKQ